MSMKPTMWGIDGFEFPMSVWELNNGIPQLFMAAKEDFESKREVFTQA